jgi:hypothetical protein
MLHVRTGILTVLLLYAPATQANSWESGGMFPDIPAGATALIILDLTLDVGGVVFAIGTASYTFDCERAPAGWEIGSFIIGVPHLIEGLVGMAVFAGSDGDGEFLLAFGLCNLALAAADIGFAIWSTQLPKRGERRFSVSPMIIPDSQGRPAVGVSLQVINW